MQTGGRVGRDFLRTYNLGVQLGVKLPTRKYESVLTCPYCGFARRETMPVDACPFFYECLRCHARLRPRPGDCCVFCSFGSVRWTQCEGEPRVEIRAGDVIWCPPGHKHWHGATSTTDMTHIAIQEALDGKNVNWLEKVTDEQYLGSGEPQ